MAGFLGSYNNAPISAGYNTKSLMPHTQLLVRNDCYVFDRYTKFWKEILSGTILVVTGQENDPVFGSIYDLSPKNSPERYFLPIEETEILLQDGVFQIYVPNQALVSTGPKNNDGRKVCFICGGPTTTESWFSYNKIHNRCPKCKI